jgi:hypothetical protein
MKLIIVNSYDTTFTASLSKIINGSPGPTYQIGHHRSEDFLLITSIDHENNIIKGEFSVKLYKFMHESDQITISEGQFDLMFTNE